MSSSHVSEGSQGGKWLVCLSQLPHVEVNRIKECRLCRWRSYYVVRHQCSRFVGTQDPDDGLLIVVKVLVTVRYRPSLARELPAGRAMLYVQLLIDCQSLIHLSSLLRFHSRFLPGRIFSFLDFNAPECSCRFHQFSGMIEHSRPHAPDPRGA